MRAMFGKVVAAFVLVAAVACSGEKPKSAHTLALETINHADTKGVVATFFQCLTDAAPKTPNGKDALDLTRINNVIEACQPEEETMKAQVKTAFGGKDSARAMKRRLEGLNEEAWKLIREHPFEPPSETVQSP
jgi:hypothetical protein